MIDARHFLDVLDVRAYRTSNPDYDQYVSDHNMLGVRLRESTSNIVKDIVARRCNFATANVNDLMIMEEFNSVLNTKLMEAGNNCSWTEYENIIRSSAEQAIGFLQRARDHWFDDEGREVTKWKIDLLKSGYNK